jgi:hypothetical protein
VAVEMMLLLLFLVEALTMKRLMSGFEQDQVLMDIKVLLLADQSSGNL